MKDKKQEAPKQPGFMFTLNFNGKDWSTSFMSKDMSKDSIAFLLGLNIANFFMQSTPSKDEYVSAIDKFMVGLEDITEKYIWPAFADEKAAATKQIVEQIKKAAAKKAWHKTKCTKNCTCKKKKKS